MGKIISFFKQFDAFLFKSVSKLIRTPVFLKLHESFSSLSEGNQKITNHILSLLGVFFPIIVILLIMISNFALRSTINDQRTVISLIKEINEVKQEMDKVDRLVLAAKPITLKSHLNRTLSTIASRIGSPIENFKVTDFKKEDADGKIDKSVATVKFSSLTSVDLTSFLKELITRQKMNVSNIQILKDRKSELLEGELTIVNLSKSNDSDG